MVELHSQRKQALVVRLLRALLGLWGSFTDWDSEDLVTARAGTAVLQVESVLREVQREQRQFDMRVFAEMGIPQPTMPNGIDIYPRSEVDLLDVYRRPARDYIDALNGGASEAEARVAFERRLKGIIEADVAIAARDEKLRIHEQMVAEGLAVDTSPLPLHDENLPTELPSQEEMQAYIDRLLEEQDDDGDEPDWDERPADWEDDEFEAAHQKLISDATPKKVIGYRRVLRPELSQHGPCGLCVVAATRWYTIGDLQAIHHDCKCVTLPVTKDSDPGRTMNATDLRDYLDRIYEAAGGTTDGRALKRVQVEILEHGELGRVVGYVPKNPRKPKPKYVTDKAPKYSRPNADTQRRRLARREEDLLGTKANLEARLLDEPDHAGLKAAIWEVEQQLLDLRMRNN